MSIAVTESRDSRLALDALDQQAARHEVAVASLTRMFMNEALAGDMKANSELERRRVYIPGNPIATYRPARVGEVLADSLDYSDGPGLDDVLDVLARAASGEDIGSVSRSLLLRMACKWAEMQITE